MRRAPPRVAVQHSPLPSALGSVDVHDTAAVAAAHRRRFLVPVRQPLVLITQVQRCGGTLLSQLLDGHPQLHVHPSELHIGRPNKLTWPALDLSRSANELFDDLKEGVAFDHARDGYQKLSLAEMRNNPNHREMVLPFLFAGGLQRELFVALAEREPPQTQRAALDCYATSYFNAWLDYAGLYRTGVRYWAGFVARLLADPENLTRFRADYPDGRLLVPLRDPVSWYASASEHAAEYADPAAAAALWVQCNQTALAEHARGGLMLVRFERLVTDTNATMRAVARFVGIRFASSLRRPTFNGMAIASDSSFGAKVGMDPTAVDRSDRVPAEVQAVLRERTDRLYAELLKRAAA